MRNGELGVRPVVMTAIRLTNEELEELPVTDLVSMVRDQEREFAKIISALTEIYRGPGRAFRVQVDDETHVEVTIKGSAPLHAVLDATIAALQGVYMKVRPRDGA